MWRLPGAMIGVLAALMGCTSNPAPEGERAPNAKEHRSQVKLTKLDDRVRVEVGGELFTEYVYKGKNHPYLYPLMGPEGVALNRGYPMDSSIAGEAHDHRHHTSLWLGHGQVNGQDFWHENLKGSNKNRPIGTIETEKLIEVESGQQGRIKVRSAWKDADDHIILKDITEMRFSDQGESRTIDYTVTLFPQGEDVVFGDNKEGFMAARLHPALRLKGELAQGRVINSEGLEGKQVWGKRARWVSYSAPFDVSANMPGGKPNTYGVTLMGHPSNPRYPTTYHARGYGLLAANPFGLSQFENKAPGSGDLRIKKGESLTFRYRWVFHKGDAISAGINKIQKEFEKDTPTIADRTFTIGVVPGAMKFDFKAFDVRAGEILQLNFRNNGLMPHNFVLTRRGKADDVLKASQDLGSDGLRFDYLPSIEDLIVGTKVLQPGQEQTLFIAVPDEAGKYPFLCTFPGHGFVMRGVMNVRRKRQVMRPPLEENAKIKEVKDALKESDANAFPQGTLQQPYVIHTYMPRLGLGDEVFAHHNKGYEANQYSPAVGDDVPGTVDTLKGLPATISVNLGQGLSYTWDTLEGRLMYAWTGGFLDMNEYWGLGKGGNRKRFGYLPKVIGSLVYRTSGKHPINIEGQGERISYQGYQLEKGIPTFLYKIGTQEVRERILPQGADSFVHHYQLPGNSSLVKVSGVSIIKVGGSEKKGESWHLNGKQGQEFSVTVQHAVARNKQ